MKNQYYPHHSPPSHVSTYLRHKTRLGLPNTVRIKNCVQVVSEGHLMNEMSEMCVCMCLSVCGRTNKADTRHQHRVTAMLLFQISSSQNITCTACMAFWSLCSCERKWSISVCMDSTSLLCCSTLYTHKCTQTHAGTYRHIRREIVSKWMYSTRPNITETRCKRGSTLRHTSLGLLVNEPNSHHRHDFQNENSIF